MKNGETSVRQLTWRQILKYLAYVFAALSAAGFIYTLINWYKNPANEQWEPLNVVAKSAFAALASFISIMGSRKVPNKPLINIQSPPRRLIEQNWQRNRHNVLQNIQHTWIDGFLRNSLHNAAIVELGLMYKPDAVSRMLEFVLQRPNQPNQSDL